MNFSKSELKKCDCFQLLVVDDDAFWIQAVQILMKDFDLKYSIAKNGEEAIKKVQEKVQ